MSDDLFSAEWLELREPVDHRSRAGDLLPLLQQVWESRGWTRILDLGSGTGSNLRYLAPQLSGTQHWTLVDHDPSLLARVEQKGVPESPRPGERREVRHIVGDLSEIGEKETEEADLVTASALLDLVSEDWLSTWVQRISRHGCGALLVLSYDGSVEWIGPRDPEDSWVLERVNRHQRREKGLGRALGPDATERARSFFERSGYLTWILPSPWILGPGDESLALALLSGWMQAAGEEDPGATGRIRDWGARRAASLRSGEAQIRVGHQDLLALPAGICPP